MDLISAGDVIRRIEMYLDGAKNASPSTGDAVPPESIPSTERFEFRRPGALSEDTARVRADEFIKTIGAYPATYRGRGIVICGGGLKYFTCAWVTIKMLREVGCTLPIQLWYLGRSEVDERMESLLSPLNVACIDALEVRKRHPVRVLNGWELKAYAILHCPFQEVLLLDSDSLPVINPEPLFEAPDYAKTGSIFWPDLGRLKRSRPIWRLCGVEYRDEPEFESGQIVVDKKRCWEPLSLAMWYNENSDFFYKHIHGDKDTFHFAFRRLKQEYSMPNAPVKVLAGVFCQHDFAGNRVFQHYTRNKWTLFDRRPVVPGLFHEYECRKFLDELRTLWKEAGKDLQRFDPDRKSDLERRASLDVVGRTFEYHRVGFESRALELLQDGTIGLGAAGCEQFWDLIERDGVVHLVISSERQTTCRLIQGADKIWRGRWEIQQKMPVEITPIEAAREVGIELPQEGIVLQRDSAVDKKSSRNDQKRLVFRADINSYTGYGLHACQIVTDLEDFGYEVNLHPTSIDEQFSPIPQNVRKNMIAEEPNEEWELVLHPPNFLPSRKRRTVYFTMWESSRLASGSVAVLNRAECVIVPCHWNADCFAASGVNRPIKIVPLGIDTQAFRFSPMNMDGPCVFGTAGRMAHGGMRKGINQIIDLFQKAFPSETDVRLVVKGFPDCAIHPVKDKRITVLQKYLSAEELARWFASLTCFVSAARGEAWGLMQQQALAIGRPIISVRYGGVAEFFDEKVGYPVRFAEVPADGEYARCGDWADPDEGNLMEQMRDVYLDRRRAQALGEVAAKKVYSYSWQNSTRELLKVLQELHVVV
jgi:hypothetical protein